MAPACPSRARPALLNLEVTGPPETALEREANNESSQMRDLTLSVLRTRFSRFRFPRHKTYTHDEEHWLD